MTEYELIVAIITQPAAYAVDLFGMLIVSRLENGRYVVSEPEDSSEFADPGSAVTLFLQRRQELKLGFDYEETLPAVQKPTP